MFWSDIERPQEKGSGSIKRRPTWAGAKATVFWQAAHRRKTKCKHCVTRDYQSGLSECQWCSSRSFKHHGKQLLLNVVGCIERLLLLLSLWLQHSHLGAFQTRKGEEEGMIPACLPSCWLGKLQAEEGEQAQSAHAWRKRSRTEP